MAASIRSQLARWIGGGASYITRAGLRSLLARWIGGASAEPIAQAGIRSPFAFWLGGAGVGIQVTPPTPQLGGGFGFETHRYGKSRIALEAEERELRRKKRLEEEDEELLLLI